jgi:hypothetical protein
MLRCLEAYQHYRDSDNASATEMPPRKPPHVMLVTVPGVNFRQCRIIVRGTATLTQRASRIAGMASSPA